MDFLGPENYKKAQRLEERIEELNKKKEDLTEKFRKLVRQDLPKYFEKRFIMRAPGTNCGDNFAEQRELYSAGDNVPFNERMRYGAPPEVKRMIINKLPDELKKMVLDKTNNKKNKK